MESYEVVEARLCTPVIRELWLRPLAQSLEHVAGEFVLLQDDEQAVPERSYSIANALRRDRLIALLITRVPGGRTRLKQPCGMVYVDRSP